jgi:hypothetical protein
LYDKPFKPLGQRVFKLHMKPKPFTCLLGIALITLYSCNKNDSGPLDPCAGFNPQITFTKTESVGSLNNGTITINEPRGDTISYKLNSGIFQDSWYFTNISPGDHVITIKNSSKSCTDTVQIKILNYGPKYALVKQIITGYCGPCHLNGGISGGMNFETDVNIVAAKDRIKIRTVDGIPTYMPENSQLTNIDKQRILDWINSGGTVSN